jgi:hypothetical protein
VTVAVKLIQQLPVIIEQRASGDEPDGRGRADCAREALRGGPELSQAHRQRKDAALSARGMTGWIGAFGAFAPPAATSDPALLPASPSRAAGAAPGDPWSLPGADEVVAVLAQMVLPLAA